MGLGLKRICDACGAKFYDLEADPIICPKCGEVHDPETAGKPKRGRKKAVKKVDEKKLDKIEINIEDEDLELMIWKKLWLRRFTMIWNLLTMKKLCAKRLLQQMFLPG